MAYDLKLAERIRTELKGQRCVEKKMFGGTGYMLNGNLACGVTKDALIVRVPLEKYAELLKRPHVRPFAMTGRPMKGWLVVDAKGCKTDKQLSAWVQQGVQFARTLPAK